MVYASLPYLREERYTLWYMPPYHTLGGEVSPLVHASLPYLRRRTTLRRQLASHGRKEDHSAQTASLPWVGGRHSAQTASLPWVRDTCCADS